MDIREIFPTYIENLQFDKKIEITRHIHFDRIHPKIKAKLEQTRDWQKEQVVYPLHFEIVNNIDPDRQIYFESNYAFIVDNAHSDKKDLINVAIFLNSEFKNLLNFAIVASTLANPLVNIPPRRRLAQKPKGLVISSENSFSYCGKHNILTNDEFNNIMTFIQNENVIAIDKKKLIIERIANYFRMPIGPINRGYRNIRYLELVSILESLISDLGKDSLINKFKSSFSALLAKYYLLDKDSERTLLNNIYSIRSNLTHSGSIDENDGTIKKYWKGLAGADFEEKYNTALYELEDRFKKIIKVYLEKNITFQIVEIIEEV